MSCVANCPHGFFVGNFVVVKQFDGAVPRPGGQNVLLGVELQTGHLFVVVVQGSNGDPQTRSTTTLFDIFQTSTHSQCTFLGFKIHTILHEYVWHTKLTRMKP